MLKSSMLNRAFYRIGVFRSGVYRIKVYHSGAEVDVSGAEEAKSVGI